MCEGLYFRKTEDVMRIRKEKNEPTEVLED